MNDNLKQSGRGEFEFSITQAGYTLTLHDLNALPAKARVALAARCARRLLVLINRDTWTPAGVGKAIFEAAVAATENSAARSTSVESVLEAWRISREIVKIAERPTTSPSSHVIQAIFDAAEAASFEAYSPRSSSACLYSAICHAVRAGRFVAGQMIHTSNGEPLTDVNGNSIFGCASSDIMAALRADYDLLVAAATREGWNDGTPVPPEFFGPLWPFGVPEGWPEKEESSEKHELVVTLDFPADASDEEIERRVREVSRAANGLHHAYGGHGLKVDFVEIESPASAEVRS